MKNDFLEISSVLIDGDMFVYRSGFSVESRGVALESLQIAISRLDSMLVNSIFKVNKKLNDIKIFLSGSGNFRFSIDPNYKIRRKTMKKPVYYQELREHMLDVWSAKIINDAEADDAMGVEAWKQFHIKTSLGIQCSSSCIISNDKDLNMIPGWHYNPIKQEKYFIEYFEGLKNFYKQLLTGDKADDIIGPIP